MPSSSMKDDNLIMFFSWGRKEIMQKSFINLIENIRPQDRLMVIDQEMHNANFYIANKDKIDFLVLNKLNYKIGSIWGYLKFFLEWKKETELTFGPKLNRGRRKPQDWYPKYINIIESDTIGKKGWIDRLVKVFEKDKDIEIVSGYEGKEHPIIRQIDNVNIKNIVCGIQLMVRADYYKELIKDTILHATYQDGHFTELNFRNHKLSAVLPGEIIHIGAEKGKKLGFILD